jgi:hypothetical protein
VSWATFNVSAGMVLMLPAYRAMLRGRYCIADLMGIEG